MFSCVNCGNNSAGVLTRGHRCPNCGHVMRLASRPKIVCICGSTRFWRKMHEIVRIETEAGRIVLSVGCNAGSDEEHGILDGSEFKNELIILHLHKIEMCDEVLVANIGGYIGKETRKEINDAALINKPIRYWEPIDGNETGN